MVRVQSGITGKAEKLWRILPRMSRSLAIEQGLIKIAEDEKLAAVFFKDVELVKEILNAKENICVEDNSQENCFDNNSNGVKTNDDKGEQVENFWS